MTSANDRQVAGSHYRSGTQPWDVFLELFGLSFHMCNCAKYLVRWRKKNGLEDLQKSKHYLEKTIESARNGWTNPIILEANGTIAMRLIEKMVKDNDIPPSEYTVIDIVLRWTDVRQLEHAMEILDNIINGEVNAQSQST